MLRPPAGQVGSSFAAGLMASLLHSASKERVGLGVALLAVMGLLRHAEPDSMDAEVSNEAPKTGIDHTHVHILVCLCLSAHFSSPVDSVGWPCTRAPCPPASAAWSSCTAPWCGWLARPLCPAPPPSCEPQHVHTPTASSHCSDCSTPYSHHAHVLRPPSLPSPPITTDLLAVSAPCS